MSIEYAIIVRSKTRLEALIERFNTKAQARFYIESLGGNFEEYQAEHDTFYRALEMLQGMLSRTLKNKVLYRNHLPNYLFADNNLIIVIGQDGLVANTAKYARGLPIIAINPDPRRYDGILLPFAIQNFLSGVEQVLSGSYPAREVRFAEASLQDGQKLLAFNDLFIGASSHVSARYKIKFKTQSEDHSSSGIIVSTQAGSTGWLSSIFNMAYGVAGLFQPDITPQKPQLAPDQLLFAVREPFKSVRTQTDLSVGIIRQPDKLTIESYMPNNGIIFSDGVESDFLRFNSGAVVSVGIADAFARLVLNERNHVRQR
ncbi:MAG: sugar kinase [Bacteroidota bacterium]